MIKMKALRSFHGSSEGKVRRGREFTASRPERARELEAHGLAYPLEVKSDRPHLNKMDPPPSNKAADAGPLDFPGGATGADALVPSSLPAPPRRKRRSRVSTEGQATPAEVKTDLLS